jgi:hypothetical protein
VKITQAGRQALAERAKGRMIVMAFSTDGNHRYSWTKNKRSQFVRWTRPRIFRCNMIS